MSRRGIGHSTRKHADRAEGRVNGLMLVLGQARRAIQANRCSLALRRLSEASEISGGIRTDYTAADHPGGPRRRIIEGQDAVAKVREEFESHCVCSATRAVSGVRKRSKR